jgi:hypothetical protein
MSAMMSATAASASFATASSSAAANAVAASTHQAELGPIIAAQAGGFTLIGAFTARAILEEHTLHAP